MNGSQLDLWEGEVSRMPWRGKSPRELTRGAIALFLRRKPQKDERFFVDPDQVDIWPAGVEGPRGCSPGAPLLVEPREGR